MSNDSTVLLKAPEILIPGYRILRPIGEGGMASVFLAVQESLDREVALKVMAPALAANTEFTERFVSEGKITAKLSHPNLVTVFDIGSHQNVYYLAAEYIAGGTLKERIDEGMSVAEMLDVICEVARGLDFAHGKGFVHRDVKPGNILFKSDGTSVLADFGIAKAMDASSGATMVGASIGTPDYMSPEQARAEKVDGRSDLYSLGTVAFEMFTGEPPYQASDPFTVALMHVTQPVPKLSGERVWLQPLIDAMMAKDAAQRVATGDAVVGLIEQLCAAAPEGALLSGSKKGGGRGRTRSRTTVPYSALTRPSGASAADTARLKRPMMIGAAAVVAVFIALGAWWMLRDKTDVPIAGQPIPGQTIPGRDLELVIPDTPAAEDELYTDIERKIEEANGIVDVQTAQGWVGNNRLVEAAGGPSAFSLYQEVLESDPDNVDAKAGIERIHAYYLRTSKIICDRKLYVACEMQAAWGLIAKPDDPELLELRRIAAAQSPGPVN